LGLSNLSKTLSGSNEALAARTAHK